MKRKNLSLIFNGKIYTTFCGVYTNFRCFITETYNTGLIKFIPVLQFVLRFCETPSWNKYIKKYFV